MYSVRYAFVMPGSGTLANEVMLFQIKNLNSKGLILSNGEFGCRLVGQALRIGLSFVRYEVDWGTEFNVDEIEHCIGRENLKWLLFCHCETSTGMLNDLDALTNLCASYDLHSFVDCMSSVGTTQLDLSKISMATASSGKALAAFSGLALVFSNFKPTELRSGPLYFDLGYYLRKGYIPFTISSNFINALSYSISQKATGDQYLLIDKYGLRFFDIFRSYHLVPYSSRCSKVFTIVLPDGIFGLFVKEMEEKNISLSYKSDYLKSRSWIQLALFGYYQEKELNYAYSTIEKSLRELIVCRTI